MAENKTVEVGGIEVPADPAKLTDFRFVTMMGDLNDPTLPDVEKMAVQSALLRFVFGERRAEVLDSIADANGGTLTNEAFSEWWVAYLTEANAKN